MYLVIAGTISARSAANRRSVRIANCIRDAKSPENHCQHQRHRDNGDDFPPNRPIAQRPRRGPFRRRGFGAVARCGLTFGRRTRPRSAGKQGHRNSAVLASAPLNRSVSASFMRLPANCAHPERRGASDIRLAIQRVCQAPAAVTTVLTEQTEFTDVLGTRLPSAEQMLNARDLRRAKERDEEIGVISEGPQTPRRQQQIGHEPSVCCVIKKLVELVSTIGAEADRCPTVADEVGTQPAQHLDSGTRGKECHHVAGRHDHVERFGDAAGGQVRARRGRRRASAGRDDRARPPR